MSLRTAVGVVLITTGGAMALANLGLLSGSWVLGLVGVAFFALYFLRGGRSHYGNVGILIAASVILAVAVAAELLRVLPATGGGVFFLVLGGAFWLAYVVHTVRFTGRGAGARHWPAAVGAGLWLFVGLLVGHVRLRWDVALRRSPWPAILLVGGRLAWPTILVVAGLALILSDCLSRSGR